VTKERRRDYPRSKEKLGGSELPLHKGKKTKKNREMYVFFKREWGNRGP